MKTDIYTGSPIHEAAEAALADFRAAGAKSFDQFEISELRKYYEDACATWSFEKTRVSRVEEALIAGVPVRVYHPLVRSTVATGTALIFAHGGGWVMGSLDTHDTVCRQMADKTSLPVIAVDYRLAPEFPFPAAYQDVQKVVNALDEISALVEQRITQLSLMGDSAGAQIIASIAVAASHHVENPLDSIVLVYPVTSMAYEGASYTRVSEGFPLTGPTMRWFKSLYLGNEKNLLDPRLSPADAAIGKYAPRALIFSCDLDPLAEDGVRLANRLIESSTEVSLHHFKGLPHGLLSSAKKYPQAFFVLNEATRFITHRPQNDQAPEKTP